MFSLLKCSAVYQRNKDIHFISFIIYCNIYVACNKVCKVKTAAGMSMLGWLSRRLLLSSCCRIAWMCFFPQQTGIINKNISTG